MHTETLRGRWNELKGNAKRRWGKLTEDDLKQVQGEVDQLAGKVQQRYGVSKEEATKQVDDFCKAC
jgi:uncharacterized protein YjbJ (UPF0337 family)